MDFLLLLLTLPLARASDTDAGPDLPDLVAESCVVDTRAHTGLLHLRCGPSRLLVAQLRAVEGDVHEELLESVVDLVPPPAARRDLPDAGAGLRRTVVSQARGGLPRGQVSVHLELATRSGTGRSVACVVGLVGRKRADRQERAWCEQVTTALLPPPEHEPTTRVTVEAPDLPPGDLTP